MQTEAGGEVNDADIEMISDGNDPVESGFASLRASSIL